MSNPDITQEYLNTRGITDEVIHRFGITWGEKRISIPYFSGDKSNVVMCKYRRSPFEQDMTLPKYTYSYGSTAQLYGGWELAALPDGSNVYITEGEFDSLVLWGQGIPAVSSSGGCKVFRQEWVDHLKRFNVTVCLDADTPGIEGMWKILRMFGSVTLLLLPCKDITDFFAVGHGRLEDFLTLPRQKATYFDNPQALTDEFRKWAPIYQRMFGPCLVEEIKKISSYRPEKELNPGIPDDMIARAKAVPIPHLIKMNNLGKAPCIFHKEKTPSLHYYPQDNHVYCHGCGRRADAIDVYMELHHCSFKTALQELGK